MGFKLDKPDLRTKVTFGLIGDLLSVDEINNALGIVASRAFEKDELFVGRQRVNGEIVEIERRRPRGVWQLSTIATVTSDRILDHANALLAQLEPKANEIKRLRASNGLFSRISICHVGSGSFELPSDVATRLAGLCDEVSITCWEVNDDHDTIVRVETAGQ